MSKDEKKGKREVYYYYRMKKKNGMYCLERVKSDGEKVLEIKDGEENLFEIIHELLSSSVRNDLAMGIDHDERPF